MIHDAGDHVFYVSARANWYPAAGLRFANYDLTFRFPREFDLVGTGDIIEDRTEGDTRIVRRRPGAPIRIAAFNLGDYTHARLERGGYVIDVCANRKLETALQPPPRAPGPSALPNLPGIVAPPPAAHGSAPWPPWSACPTPLEHLQALADEVASAMEFMASKFGPPALPHLTVSPIPGTFGQGFPGPYLSLHPLLFQEPSRHPHRTGPDATAEIFFGDVLQAHETAHQWWGNRVTAATYRDNWLMEALANTSALLYLEKRRGTHSVEQMLDNYRTALLAKNESGQPVDSAGPIVLGTRLESSQEPRAWRTITYGKGSWIMQMLRARMGPDRFLALLAEICKRYDRKEITTEEFRLLAADLPPAEIRRPQTGELLRTVGLRHRHSRHEAVVHREGRGAQREAHRHPHAIRRR